MNKVISCRRCRTTLFARSVIKARKLLPFLMILTFMTAMLKACRISSGVDNRTPSSLLDFRRRWAAVKAPESLSVSVSFSDAWKYDSTLKPLWCIIPSESLLVDCMLISVRFVFISPRMFAVATCANKYDVLPCKIDLPSTTYAARKLLINIGIALSKIPLQKNVLIFVNLGELWIMHTRCVNFDVVNIGTPHDAKQYSKDRPKLCSIKKKRRRTVSPRLTKPNLLVFHLRVQEPKVNYNKKF